MDNYLYGQLINRLEAGGLEKPETKCFRSATIFKENN